MKMKLLALFMGTSLVLAACGGDGDRASDSTGETNSGKDTASNGEEIYKNASCVGCHGQDLGGGAGPNLQKIGGKYNAEEIEKIILNGQGTMPKEQLKGDDAKAVAQWLAEKK